MKCEQGQTVINARGVLAFRGRCVVDKMEPNDGFDVLLVHLENRPDVWFSLHSDDVDPA